MSKDESIKTGRKIDLPDFCCEFDREIIGGRDDCDHDFPPESKDSHDTWVGWTCSRCGRNIRFGVYQ